MTGSSMEIINRTAQRHAMTTHVSSIRMLVSVFGNLDIRRTSISWTVSGPGVAAGWCKHALNRLLDGSIMSRSDLLSCLSNRRISHSSAYSGILAPETADQIISATSQQFLGLAMVTHQSEFSMCGLAKVTCSYRK